MRVMNIRGGQTMARGRIQPVNTFQQACDCLLNLYSKWPVNDFLRCILIFSTLSILLILTSDVIIPPFCQLIHHSVAR